MKAEDLVRLIRKRYEGHEGNAYVVLEQVPNVTGLYQTRWIDVAVFSLWPSNGLTRSAFEIKVARSDFIRELQNPLKHEWVKDCFHEFWFVAPKDIIQIGELPEGVGLMQASGSKLVIKKHCCRNYAPNLNDSLLAAFMRAAHNEIVAAANRDKQELLNSDIGHNAALSFQKAVETFLKSRGVPNYFPEPTVGLIETSLEEATLDKGLRQEREHLLSKLGEFQRDMTQLFSIFAVIANRSLLKRNELGDFVVGKYGGHDDEALESIRELRGRDKYRSNKRYADLIDSIINWNTEFER